MADLFKFLEKYGGAPEGGNGKYLGKVIAVPPLGQDEEFNFTLPKGKGTDLWISFFSNLDNKGYKIQKVSETLEVSPVDVGYYNLTQKQKEEMEIKIKQGLASVASAVSDYELISHDVRKYKEILKMIKTNDEHSLRAMFIDEVDISTGVNAMKSMVVRWPTIIADFMELGEKIPDEVDANKIKKELKISKAEAVILSTKQRLYKNWKQIFGSEVESRFSRLIALQNSKKKTIEEYKKWLKPLIARHKLYKEGLASSSTAKSMLLDLEHSPGQAVSTNKIVMWAWQPIVATEPRGGTLERKARTKFGIDPYDLFTKNELIFNKNGLKGEYPWITEEWVNKAVEEIKNPAVGWMKESNMYYVLLTVEYSRKILKMPSGKESEDITLKTKNWFLSQNALLVLLLKLKAEQEEFDREVNQMLGITNEYGMSSEEEVEKIIEKWKMEEKKEKKDKFKGLKTKVRKIKDLCSKISNFLSFNFAFSRFGPYEHNFSDRITQMYLINTAIDFYVPHVREYLIKLAGVGN